jgi:hypothetical protein
VFFTHKIKNINDWKDVVSHEWGNQSDIPTFGGVISNFACGCFIENLNSIPGNFKFLGVMVYIFMIFSTLDSHL